MFGRTEIRLSTMDYLCAFSIELLADILSYLKITDDLDNAIIECFPPADVEYIKEVYYEENTPDFFNTEFNEIYSAYGLLYCSTEYWIFVYREDNHKCIKIIDRHKLYRLEYDEDMGRYHHYGDEDILTHGRFQVDENGLIYIEFSFRSKSYWISIFNDKAEHVTDINSRKRFTPMYLLSIYKQNIYTLIKNTIIVYQTHDQAFVREFEITSNCNKIIIDNDEINVFTSDSQMRLCYDLQGNLLR